MQIGNALGDFILFLSLNAQFCPLSKYFKKTIIAGPLPFQPYETGVIAFFAFCDNIMSFVICHLWHLNAKTKIGVYHLQSNGLPNTPAIRVTLLKCKFQCYI